MRQNGLATVPVRTRPARAEVEPIDRAAARVQLTIDGVQVTVESGVTILDAARQNGIEIPVLCHQPNERPVAVCRLCSVDTGERTLAAACARPVENGMVVETNSERVRSARGILLELLLADHPSPCARQRRSGDCELENLAASSGITQSRFHPGQERRGRDDSSTAIAVDHDACILCDRCIRACNEVRHNNVIGRMGKGYAARIAFDLNDAMGSSSCISCGECMVSCPTGALTNKVVVPASFSDGQPVDTRRLKELPYFEGISSTFLELNRNAVVSRRYREGDVIYREGEYGSTAFLILEGKAEMFTEPVFRPSEEKRQRTGILNHLKRWFTGEQTNGTRHSFETARPPAMPRLELGRGALIGETSCISQYPRAESVRAVTDVVGFEILRNVLEMMLQRDGKIRDVLDANYRERALAAHLRATPLFSRLSDRFVQELKRIVKLKYAKRAETILRRGAPSDSFYVIRNGFVKIADDQDGDRVLQYVGPRQHFGLTTGRLYPTTASALDHVALIQIDRQEFQALLDRFPEDRVRFAAPEEPRAAERSMQKPLRLDVSLEQFLHQGLMDANSVLILDLDKCTRCDCCVKACAEAHGGVTRLVRDGLRFDKYLVATSCRQCRDPLCMVGCPVGSIRRRASLEIVIEDWCIGCGLCANNCPYGSINMHPVDATWANSVARRPVVQQKATACDLCAGLAEPSCVYACPHDAAQRVDAAQFFQILPGRPGIQP